MIPRRELPPHRGWTVLRILLAVLAVSALVGAFVLAVAGRVQTSLGPLKLRSEGPARALALSAAAAVLLLALGWRSAWSRRLSATVLVIVAPLTLLARHVDTAWPVGDGALIELYTLNAIDRRQLLGPYSAYGWHHPGPLLFYWFAPFYWMANGTTFGLSVAVLFTNMASLGIVAWLLVRRRETRATFAISLSVLLAVYVTRVPDLLTSAWNPHTPMFPLIALLALSAEVASTTPTLLPFVVLLASFITQTDVAFAVVASVLCLMAVSGLCFTAWSRPNLRHSTALHLVGAVFLLQVLWLAPLAEEITHTPGNMTLIFRFFFSDGLGPPLNVAWRAWSTTLVSVFTPDFSLALGGNFQQAPTIWPSIVGTATVLALLPAAFFAWRGGRRFMSVFALGCLLTSAAGLYSVWRIRGEIHDYHVFWLSLLGVVNVSVVLGEAAAGLCRRLGAQGNLWIVRTATWLMLIDVLATGALPMMAPVDRPYDFFSSGIDGRNVRNLSMQLVDALPSAGHHPIVRSGEGMWALSAGLVLQMKLRHVPVSVAPEMVFLFGESLVADGREDLLLIVARRAEHEELAKLPFHVTLAESGGVFVDAVSLIDAPQFRP